MSELAFHEYCAGAMTLDARFLDIDCMTGLLVVFTVTVLPQSFMTYGLRCHANGYQLSTNLSAATATE